MEQLAQFLMNHQILALAFFGILGALVWTTFQGAGGNKVSPADATRMINHENAVVLDVRGNGEFDRGHVVNAVHIPLDQLPQKFTKLNRYKDRPIITACGSGQASSAACKTLRAHGFEKVYQLQGGMTAWQGADLPITKD